MVGAQLDAVLDDFDGGGGQDGHAGHRRHRAPGGRPGRGGRPPALVVDPVMVASTGRRLLDDDAVAAYRGGSLPHALLVTPNLFEAAILAGVEPADGADVDGHGRPGHAGSTARADLGAGQGRAPPRGARRRTGAPAPSRVADVLFDGTDVTVLEQDRVVTRNNHGTGCSLASATAALLARGADVPTAVDGGQGLRAPGPGRAPPAGTSAGATGRSTRSAGPRGRTRGLGRHRTRRGERGHDRGRVLRPGLCLPRNPPCCRYGPIQWI